MDRIRITTWLAFAFGILFFLRMGGLVWGNVGVYLAGFVVLQGYIVYLQWATDSPDPNWQIIRVIDTVMFILLVGFIAFVLHLMHLI